MTREKEFIEFVEFVGFVEFATLSIRLARNDTPRLSFELWHWDLFLHSGFGIWALANFP
jgi:hypothetical protein